MNTTGSNADAVARAENQARFPVGQIVATPAALAGLAGAGQGADEFLNRHRQGDWGELGAEDRAANDHAVASGERLLSAYRLKDQTKIWIITEADRSCTTLLLPDDY